MKQNRWAVLMVFFGVAAMSQMLWLNFAPLISFLQVKYATSELMVSLLLLSFPLLYVLLSIHSGVMIDKKGYRYTILVGSVISVLFSFVRIFDDNFYILLIGQTGIAIGQPYIVNGISKLVVDWFEKEHVAMATGIGTAGMLIGMALGMGLTPVLNDSIGFQQTMFVFALLSALLTVLFFVFGKQNHAIPSENVAVDTMKEIKQLLSNKTLFLLFVIAFLALGFFNGLTTWLEPILKPHAINAEQAGIIGAYLILGGIIGSVVIPGLSDKFKKRKPFLILACVVTLVLLYPLCTSDSISTLYLLGALMGFFFLPGYALLLSMCEEVSGPEKAGTATGVLMLAGNAGAVVVIALMPVVKGDAVLWTNAIYLMILLVVITFFCAVRIKETFPR